MPSKASIAGHPYHPMIVPIVIASFILAFVFDVVYETHKGGADLVQFSYILLIIGITAALIAAIPGAIDYHTIPGGTATKRTAKMHAALNMVVLILEIVNLSFRAGKTAPRHHWRYGWILSLISVVILSVSGWLGQHIVYHHGFAVSEYNGVGAAAERRGFAHHDAVI